MAGPTRISQLTDGSPVQPTDQVPVARGSGATGYTYKVNAGRFVSDLFNVANTSTVDLTFDTSTRTLCAAANIPDASVNVFDSPTIDLDWNASTRTLSANANYLLTLINTLSTNMQNIGNYPYLEYAWVTAPNTAGQSIPANTITTLTINTEVADTGNFGSIDSNQITLSAGTYRYEVDFSATSSVVNTFASAMLTSPSLGFISRRNAQTGGADIKFQFNGQFTFNTASTLVAQVLFNGTGNMINSGASVSSNTTANADQRNTIKLWKVG